jgi:hypothetical protein
MGRCTAGRKSFRVSRNTSCHPSVVMVTGVVGIMVMVTDVMGIVIL